MTVSNSVDKLAIDAFMESGAFCFNFRMGLSKSLTTFTSMGLELLFFCNFDSS